MSEAPEVLFLWISKKKSLRCIENSRLYQILKFCIQENEDSENPGLFNFLEQNGSFKRTKKQNF